MDEQFKHSVKLGNGAKMMVMGKGSVKLVTARLTQVVRDVFFIPEHKNNLLSIGQLQGKGLAIIMKVKVCKIYHPTRGLIMQTLMAANRMFVLLATMITQPSNYLIASMDDLSDLWHRRYGHVNNKSLKTLESKQLVKGLPQFKATNTACTMCHRGKQHRAVIPKKSQWRASRRLQLVHADLCGPITPTSNSLKRYLLCFIDDFSRKAWIYFLAQKSETFAMFKIFKSFLEKELECDICCLRTNKGGEFTSK